MRNLSKRNILWLVPILLIVIYWYYYGPKDEITDNDYITYIKSSSYSSDSKNFEEGLKNYCKESKWVYFQTSNNQNVVEYKGKCPNNNKQVDVNLQFIVKKDKKDYEIGALLLNGEQQTKEEKNEFLQLIFK